MKVSKIVSLVCIMIIVLGIIAIFNVSSKNSNTNDSTSKIVNVGTLSGPTGFGMVELFENDKYNVTVCGSPDEIVAKIVNGDLDIAAVPTNNAAILYQKANGNVKILAVNTLGNLYVITNRDDINSVKDLDGKKVVLAGKGATPDLALSEVTKELNVEIDFKSEHAEVVSFLKAGKADIALLPEPFVTMALSSLEGYKIALDLSNEWEEKNNSKLPMGCVIVTNDFAKNKKSVNKFLKEYKKSIEYVLNNNEEAAKKIVENNVFANEKVAKDSIQRCNITIMTGEEMKKEVSKFINIINEFNPLMIGGSIPNEEFYY